MQHETPLIATLAIGLSAALFFALIALRLRLSSLVGYLLAGIAIGPFTPGFIADKVLAQQLAEIGVIFLMFSVGMHFSVKDLWSVRRIAVPGAIVQMLIATLLGLMLSRWWDWPVSAGLIFGLALSVASTVVLLRTFKEHHLLSTEDGRIVVGWLIVEDLVMAFVLVLIPVLAGSSHAPSWLPGSADDAMGLAMTLLETAIEVVILIALLLIGGRRFFPRLLQYVDRFGSKELFTLAVTVLTIGVAYGASKLFGVSLALGAFFAGIVINESEMNQQVSRKLKPLQDVFVVLFFVAMGMLFDPGILLRKPLEVLAVLSIVLIGKSLAAVMIIRLLGEPMRRAMIVSVGLAQIGEFSFILAGMAMTYQLLSLEGFNLLVAAALLSIVVNPLLLRVLLRVLLRYPSSQVV